jgi:hypothetical protein
VTYEPIQVATMYVATFAPRTTAYSRWTPKGWRPVRESLTPEVALAGLTKKGPAISAFMINEDDESHVLAYDFDTDNGMDQAYVLASVIWDLGGAAWVESSRRGAHVWCPLQRPMPAKMIRRAARSFLESALPEDASDPHIEIRPGSDTLAEGGLGHPLRLPCMPHPKTGQRGIMYTAARARLGPSLAAVLLEMTDTIPADLIEKRAGMWSPKMKGLPKTYRNTYQPSDDPYEDASASDILMRLWDVHNARPGKAVRCPAHDDRNPSLSILPDDKRAICKTPGCILNNDDHGRGTYELTTLAPGAST